MQEFKALLASEFSPYGTLSARQLTALADHYALLLSWNQRINLTRITDLADAVRLHYCESLFLAARLPKRLLRIVDIGSGGGFPGIPVAVYRPDCEVTLVESNRRKAVFLQEATRALPGVRVFSGRAEDLSGNYDWLISRAVRLEDLNKLKLSNNMYVLGAVGRKLPWGDARALLEIEA